MSDYPSDYDTFREKENRNQITYDPDKKKVFFVEDIQAVESSIIAVEQTLGINPQGSEESVADRINALESYVESLTNIILDKVFPVGSIYTNHGFDTDPHDLIGIGTWEQFAVGRTIIGVGSESWPVLVTAVSTSTERLTFDSDRAVFYTGQVVRVDSTGTTPSPLAESTDYYVISVNSTNIQLATSYANALAGTAINLTTTGSGTLMILVPSGTWTENKIVGESSHALTVSEMPTHTHTQNAHAHTARIGNVSPGDGSGFRYSNNDTGFGSVQIQPTTATNNNEGGNVAHNNMQPSLTAYIWRRID